MNLQPKAAAKTKSIIIINDRKEFLGAVKNSLRVNGYEVCCVSTRTDALCEANRMKPEMIIVNLGLKEISGIRIVNELKNARETSGIPLLILASRQNDFEKLYQTNLLGKQDQVTDNFAYPDLAYKIDEIASQKLN